MSDFVLMRAQDVAVGMRLLTNRGKKVVHRVGLSEGSVSIYLDGIHDPLVVQPDADVSVLASDVVLAP